MPGRASKVPTAGGTQATCMDLLTSLVKAQPQGPTLQQLQALQTALHALLIPQGGDDPAATQTMLKESKVAIAVCKYASEQLASGSTPTAAVVLTSLIQTSMQWLLSQTQQDSTSTYQTLQLLYHCAKCMLSSGRLLEGLSLGLLLCSHISSSSSSSSSSSRVITDDQAKELHVAAALHVLLCASELKLGANIGACEYQHHIMQASAVVQPAVECFRATGQDAAKQLEGIFKCLYKMILSAAKQVPAEQLDTPVLADLFGLLACVAVDVKQHNRLPQYITRIASDTKGTGAASVVMGVLEAYSHRDAGLLSVQCVDAAIKAVWDQPACLEKVMASPRWLPCCGSCPILAIHWQALQLHLTVLTSDDEAPVESSSSSSSSSSSMQGYVLQAAQLLAGHVSNTNEASSTGSKHVKGRCKAAGKASRDASSKGDRALPSDLDSLMLAWSGLQSMNQAAGPLTTDTTQAARVLFLGMGTAAAQLLQCGAQLAACTVLDDNVINEDEDNMLLCELGTDRGGVLQMGLSSAAAALRLLATQRLQAQGQQASSSNSSSASSTAAKKGPARAQPPDYKQQKDQGRHQAQQESSCLEPAGSAPTISSASRVCQALLRGYTCEDGWEDIDWATAFTTSLAKELTACSCAVEAMQLQQLAWAGCHHKAQQLAEAAGGLLPPGQVTAVERRGKAYVPALLQAGMYNEAAAAAAECVVLLCMGGTNGMLAASKLIQYHVHARLHALAAAEALKQAEAPVAVAADAPLPPPATTARGKGRLKGLRAVTQSSVPAITAAQPSEAEQVAHPHVPVLLTQVYAAARSHLSSSSSTAGSWLMVVAYEEALQYQRAPTSLQATSLGVGVTFLQQAAARAVECIVERVLAATLGEDVQHASAQLLAHLLLTSTGSQSKAADAPSSNGCDLLVAADTLTAACKNLYNDSSDVMDVDAEEGGQHSRQLQVLLCSAAAAACTEIALESFRDAVTASGMSSSIAADPDGTATAAAAAAGAADRCHEAAAGPMNAASSAWQQHGTYRQAAVQHWQLLADTLEVNDSNVLLMMLFPKPEICMQLVLQLWQLCHLHDDVPGMRCLEAAALAVTSRTSHARKASATAATTAVLMHQATGSAAWALSPCLHTPCLTECWGWEGSCSVEVQQLLKSLQKARVSCHGQAAGITRDAAVHLQQACQAAAALPQPSQHTHAWQLLRIQLLQMCASGLCQWGNTAEAWSTSQEALRLASLLYHRPQGSGSSSLVTDHSIAQGMAAAAGECLDMDALSLHHQELVDDRELTSDQCIAATSTGNHSAHTSEQTPPQQHRSARDHSLLSWLCASAYMCGLLQAAEINAVLGMADEAMCLLQECTQLAERAGATAVAGLSRQRTATILHGQGQTQAATALLQQVQCQNTPGDHLGCSIHNLLQGNNALLLAGLQINDGQHLRQQCWQHLRQGQQGCHQLSPALQVYAMRMDCDCHAAVAEQLLRDGNVSGAAEELQAAEKALQLAVQGSAEDAMHIDLTAEGDDTQQPMPQAALGHVPWPEMQAQLLLLKHAVDMARQPLAHPVPLQSSVGSDSGFQHGLVAVAGLLPCCKPVSDALPSLEEQLARSCTITEPSKPAAKQKFSSMRAGRAVSQKTTKQAAEPLSAATATAAVAPSDMQLIWLLQAFVLSWGYPATHTRACQQLLMHCVGAGLPHAACMFLHLSIGAATSQQVLAASSCVTSGHKSRDMQGEAASHDQQQSNDVLEPILKSAQLCITNLLQEAGLSLDSQALAPTETAHSQLVSLPSALEAAASGWLASCWRALPSQCTVTCISSTPFSYLQTLGLGPVSVQAATQGELIAVSRLRPGAVPLVLLLRTGSRTNTQEGPPPVQAICGSSAISSTGGSMSTRASSSNTGHACGSASGSGSSQVQSKASKTAKAAQGPAKSGASKAESCNPGIMSAAINSTTTWPDSAQPLLDQLQVLLQASSHSMAASTDLNTIEGKTAWWKERLLLDTQMASLLQTMQHDWLGIWGSLLLMQQPAQQQQQQQQTTQAAQQLAAQHFGHVLQQGAGYAVLCEMLQLLAAQAAHLPDAELQAAVMQLTAAAADKASSPESSAVALAASIRQLAASIQASCDESGYVASLQDMALGSSGSMSSSHSMHSSSKGMESDAEMSRRDALSLLPPPISTQRLTSTGSSSRQDKPPVAAAAATKIVPSAKRTTSRLKTLAVSGSQVKARDKQPRQVSSTRRDASTERQSAAGPVQMSRPSRSRAPVAAVVANPAPVPTRTGVRRQGKLPKAPLTAAEPEHIAGPSEQAQDDTTQPQAAVSSRDEQPAAQPQTTASQHTQQPLPLRSASNVASPEPAPMLLMLSSSLHGLPWESMPCMHASTALQVYRTPSLLFAAAMAAHLASAARASSTTQAACLGSSNNSIDITTGPKHGHGAAKATQASILRPPSTVAPAPAVGGQNFSGPARDIQECREFVVNLASTFYLINPAGDLQDTQACFESWFAKELGWQGAAGHSPPSRQLLAAMQAHALFVYLGHGSGEQYLPLAGARRRLHRLSANLLMGCSSGRLKTQGMYPPTGPLLTYLLAGCPAVVANLWDVTDKDIDRFSSAVLKHWLHSSTARRQAGEQQQGCDGAGCQQEEIAAEVGLNNGKESGRRGAAAGCSMSGAVAASRAACKLQNLIGAAPVCYGLPMQVDWSQR